MARDFQISGEALVRVKGPSGSLIANLTELGLPSDAINVSLNFKHKDIDVDAWGDVPPEVQFMLAYITISMNLVHFDRTILDECIRLSMAGGGGVGTAIGLLPRAGSRMGNNAARFASTNNFISLNIASPVAAKPWRFLSSYLYNTPAIFPVGTEKSVATLNWRVIPFTTDPWQGGSGASGQALWDHTADS